MATIIETGAGNPPRLLNFENKPPEIAKPALDVLPTISYPTYECPSYDQSLLSEYRIRTPHEISIYQPSSYRQAHYQSSTYPFPIPPELAIFEKKDLQALHDYLNLCLKGFDPWTIDVAHPIHNELLNICRKLLKHCEDLPIEKRIAYLNNAIAELIVGSNTLDLATHPKFELLEIALRNHLFQGLLYQEKSEIEKFHTFSKKIPNNLDQREIALFNFVTKNNFYTCPNYNIYPVLLGDLLSPYLFSGDEKATIDLPLESALQKNEERISNQLKALELTTPSQGSRTFEAALRDGITRKTITKIASQYKKEFQEQGTINRDQLVLDVQKLCQFNTAKGKLISGLQIGAQLIVEIFELPMSDCPFSFVRAKILQEKNEQLASPIIPGKALPKCLKWMPLPFSSPKKSAQQRQLEIEALAGRKHDTVDWAETEWQALTNPTFIPATVVLQDFNPTAPLVEPDEHIITSNLSPENTIEQTVPDVPSTPIDTIPFIPESPKENRQPVIVPKPSIPASVPSVFSPKLTAQDPSVPSISYIDIAFGELLSRGSDQEKWSSLPPITQKDALLHVHYHPSTTGKAEDLTRRIFKNDGWEIYQEVKSLSKRRIQGPVTGLKEEFITKGQELIDFYYSDKIVGQFHNFIIRFRELPKEPRFYQYVYEMAKAANVHIEPWDHQFAEYNWDQPGILHLSVQALERCLHTAANPKKN